MAFANQGRSIPQVGLRRTLRFQWMSSDREVMSRDLFCTRIIKGQLNLTVEDVFCIQWHQQATGYDVSFVSAETHQAVTARCARLANKHPLNLCEVVNMDRPNFRIISVHMFNPFMTDLALKEFFGRFSDVVSAARYVRDPLGFWTGCRQFQVLLHPDVPEAIRADASVRVTLVPGGGDLRVKLSQYADDTTLLLDIAIRRPLARTIFDFLWGGRYEWVARGRMMSGLAEGGRDVPDLPLKLDTIFVASLLQDMASEVGHPASLGMKYFFLYAARGILNWSNVGPRSEQLPWHYAWVAKWLRAHPEALEDGIWKQQRVLYRVVRGKVNPSPVLGVPSSVWVGVQAVGLSNGLKDLNWACLHRTLPVRDKIHRHGLGRSPLCPRPSCGAGETAYHVMWECSFARQLWAKAKKVVGRAKPDLTLIWQVVERSFVGAHIRSGWGILWLLLSLYKRGLWLARHELVRSEVEWSGVQRGWLRGSNGR
ncbi:hypothetical protein Q8A73_006311 [Channa argus]|nr:hypothetical protein Q8A73_006308 [Channa argus]KAK2912198.1 hypothetical protein Q8A73_006311 [Channa argus]